LLEIPPSPGYSRFLYFFLQIRYSLDYIGTDAFLINFRLLDDPCLIRPALDGGLHCVLRAPPRQNGGRDDRVPYAEDGLLQSLPQVNMKKHELQKTMFSFEFDPSSWTSVALAKSN
jgi:hypothetical protein